MPYDEKFKTLYEQKFNEFLFDLEDSFGFEELEDEGKVKVLYQVYKKFGSERIKIFVYNLHKWSDGGSAEAMLPIAKKLLKDREIMIALNGEPKTKSKWLFRGLATTSKRPAPGQSVVYTTKHSPASSWTDDLNVAKDFCSSSQGVILAIEPKEILEQNLFLWPFSKDEFLIEFAEIRDFSFEREWAVLIKSPIKVSGVSYCGSEPEGAERVRRKLEKGKK